MSDPVASAPTVTPPVFTRVVTTPPGLPWDQARIAGLEAARAAPASIETLTVQLRRLVPWQNRKSGKFLAFYAKTDMLGGGFRTSATVDGRTVSVEFKSKAQTKAETKFLAVFAGAGATAGLACLIAVTAAAAIRHGGEERLDALARLSARQLQQAIIASELRQQTAALNAIGDPGAPLAEVLGDLAWASRMRKPEVPVEAFHWRRAGFGVEVRGEVIPFKGAEARRLPQPLRPGVWLWVKVRSQAPTRLPVGATR